MSDTNLHDTMLDDVAVYALGAMSHDDAERVRAHIATCAPCHAEYRALRPAAGAVAYSAESCVTGQNGPIASELLKARIMREVRATVAPQKPATPARPAIAWPPYLLAAACIAIAAIATFADLSAGRQLDKAHATIADLTAATAKRYATTNGAIVASGDKIYVAMHDMPAPPAGHVYQAWTLSKGSKTMQPSSTFVPDTHGAAVLALPQDARTIAVVAISVEPDGGSSAPTTKPVAVVTLN